jgi:hypothetical protein
MVGVSVKTTSIDGTDAVKSTRNIVKERTMIASLRLSSREVRARRYRFVEVKLLSRTQPLHYLFRSNCLRVMLMVAICVTSFMQFFFLYSMSRDALHKNIKFDASASLASNNEIPRRTDSTTVPSTRIQIKVNTSRDAPLYTALANSTNLKFCGSCSYNILITCSERVNEVMETNNLTRAEAQNELLANCGIDYANEPYVLLHVGPHKTGMLC